MVNQHQPWMAPCGLDCAVCDIRLVAEDAGAAERVVAWYREQGWLKPDEGLPEIVKRSMYCQGCRGPRTLHWSPDCEILTCCVDAKGLLFCSECRGFPCEPLLNWATRGSHHVRALEALRRMASAGQESPAPAAA